jgi:hypothetical protein
MNTCTVCQTEYTPRAKNQKYCPDCKPKNYDYRTNQQKHETRSLMRELGIGGSPTIFVGVDGEAVWAGKPYESAWNYCLLSVGENSLHHGGEQLELSDIFDFLYSEYLSTRHNNPGRKIAFTGFFLGFDFTQWFRQLPEKRARILLTADGIAKRQRKIHPELGPFPVEWNGWEFDLLADKRFKLKPKGGKDGWLTICDAGPFFQTSLLNAADPKKWPAGIIDADDYALIIEGKKSRGDTGFDEKMIEYNRAENRVLAAMLGEYERGLKSINISLKPQQWFGPGQASSKWLGTTPTPKAQDIQTKIPPECLDAARASYYGGRFELFQHGHIPGNCYEYDINSAYPDAMQTLPDILSGEWSYHTAKKLRGIPNGLCICRGIITCVTHIGALPYRTEKGKILYPKVTAGWYWGHEINAGITAGLIDRVDITEYWRFNPDISTYPLAGVAELYSLRQSVGKNSSEGKALKLVYNSGYGKLCQSVGTPRFSNPFYASLITSGCRTKILQAIATHPDPQNGLVMIATDGIYFRSPHPTLPISENLGEWDSTIKRNLTTFLPGIYWDDKTRDRLSQGISPQLKSRGISGADLAGRIDELDRLFRTRELWPELDIPICFTYLSLKQALIGRNPLDKTESRWADAGIPLQGRLKHIKSSPHDKRDISRQIQRDTIQFDARPYPGKESTPYKRSFGMDFDEAEIMRGLGSIDGPDIASDFYGILHEN